MTVDLCGGEQGFIFPTCAWVMRVTKCRLCLSWILCCQQTVLGRILPFLVSFQYSTSGFQKIVLPALYTAGFKVQPWPKVSLQDPFPCNGYVRTRMNSCSFLLPVNCLSAISRLLQKRKKICWCELDKNLQSGIKNRCGSGFLDKLQA